MQAVIRGTGVTEFTKILEINMSKDSFPFSEFISLEELGNPFQTFMIYKNPIEIRGQAIYQFLDGGYYCGSNYQIPGINVGLRYKHYLYFLIPIGAFGGQTVGNEYQSTLGIGVWQNTKFIDALKANGIFSNPSSQDYITVNSNQMWKAFISQVTTDDLCAFYSWYDTLPTGARYVAGAMSRTKWENVLDSVKSKLGITDEMLGYNTRNVALFNKLPLWYKHNASGIIDGVNSWLFDYPLYSPVKISKEGFGPVELSVRLNNAYYPKLPNMCPYPFMMRFISGNSIQRQYTWNSSTNVYTLSNTIDRYDYGCACMIFTGVEAI